MQSDGSSGNPLVSTTGEDASNPRRFGRLRLPSELGTASDANGAADPMADQVGGNGVLPFDSAKTFVGPNGTYYDERWRWMEWRGKVQSWNWAAALSFGVWFAYRRLYGWAALWFGWLMLLLNMALTGSNLRLLGIAQLIVAVVAGRYGNLLYRQRFRRLAWQVARDQDDHGERLSELGRVGGVDRSAAWAMVVAAVVGAAGMIWHIRRTVGVEIDW